VEHEQLKQGHESLLTEERERRAKLEDQVKTANYTQQLRDKARVTRDVGDSSVGSALQTRWRLR
jgi:hypothetical protein